MKPVCDALGIPFRKVSLLRNAGWRVAVHNDYAVAGEHHTFWLFTHPVSRRFVKGEGKTDEEALVICLEETLKHRTGEKK